MTGPEHYFEAERLRDCARDAKGSKDPWLWATYFLQAAQVHATLALAAATANQDARSVGDFLEGPLASAPSKGWPVNDATTTWDEVLKS